MKITEAKKASNARYLAKCAQLNIKPKLEEAEEIKAAAAAAGQSTSAYIMQAVRERMERDQGK